MSVCVSGSGKTRRDWGYIYQGTLRKEAPSNGNFLFEDGVSNNLGIKYFTKVYIERLTNSSS